MTEKDRIVAWLRRATPGASINPSQARKVADAIEAGLHLKRPEPTIPYAQWRDIPSVGH